MNNNSARKLVVTDGIAHPNTMPERVVLVNEQGETLNIKSDAELNSTYMAWAPNPTGVALTDRTNIQTLLNTGADVFLKPGTYAIGNSPILLDDHQGLFGSAGTILYSTGGTCVGTKTPGVRTYGQKLEKLILFGPGHAVAGSVAVDMDSMSLARIRDCWVEQFETGVRLRSSVLGGCVYNVLSAVSANGCTTGFDVQSGANETRIVDGSRGNSCTSVGVKITDANHCSVLGAAFESCGVAVDLVATGPDLCITNNILDNRFETNGLGVRVGVNVADTNVFFNACTGAASYYQDRGIRTVILDSRVGVGRLPYSRRSAIHFTGATGNYASTPDTPSIRITGDLFLSAELALTDWSPAATYNVVDRATSGNISYRLYVASPTGRLGLLWTTDGTTAIAKESSIPAPVTDGTWKHIAAHLDVDNGAGGNTVTFYTSTDGVTWDVLGTPIITPGVTSVFAGTTALFIGVSNDSASGPVVGRVASATVRSGNATGTIVANWSADAQQGATRSLDSTGKVWTMTGSAWCSTLY